MKRLLICVCGALLACLPLRAELTDGGEYYIWLNIYEKVLGTNEKGDGPALSAYGTNDDGYVFVAEDSGQSGYVLLRQKNSGKYLAASSSNAWSVVFESSRSTDDRFCWKADEGCYVYLTNKKNSSSYVGIDGGKKGSTYVNVYYNKRKSSHGQFSIIPATGDSWDEARGAYESEVYTNAQGVSEIDYCQLQDRNVDRSDAVDIHITSNDNPFVGNSSVNLGSEQTWLIIDNVVPSEVISNYLQFVTIGGAPAVEGENCRVAIYLNGAAVIPLPEVAMTCDGTEGEFTLAVGNHKDLSEQGQSNTMTSFTLRRGYMATLATGANGSWYSQVFVADHADQVVTLPTALNKRVTSVNIKPWQYLSKKGWGSTGGSYGGNQLRATWFWSWSAGYNSTTDMEFVPCRQHQYWPSVSEVNSKTATAALSINEPDHAEQHKKKNEGGCDCQRNSSGTIEAWTCYGLNKDFQAGGGRIGSPQIQQDDNYDYLTKYFGYVDNNNNYSRCDIAVAHDYLDVGNRDADTYAKYVTDVYWKFWNATGRPVWLTEMEVGASWHSNTKSKINNNEKGREYLQALLQRLEESDYIERYAIYSTDWWCNYMYWEANPTKGLTPAGQVYRDHRSTFAYNANYVKTPAWWADTAKEPTLSFETNLDDKTIIFTVGCPNGDATDELVVEHLTKDGNWLQLAIFDGSRSLLESSSVTITVPVSDIDKQGDTFRVTATTLYGGSATSKELAGPVLGSEWEDFVPGDVNGNGVVDIVDVTSIISFILGEIPQDFNEKAADVNGDNEINIVDVTMVIDIILNGN